MNYLFLKRLFQVSIIMFLFLGCGGDEAASRQQSTNSGKTSSSSEITSVKTYHVFGVPYEEVIELPGATVRGFETTPLMAKLGGYVTSIGTVKGEEIDIGSFVQTGTVLATLDIPEMVDEIAKKPGSRQTGRKQCRSGQRDRRSGKISA